MGKDVAINRGGGAVARPAFVDPGKGTDIGNLSFEGRALTYEEDMPTRFRSGAKAQTELVLRKESSKSGSDLVLARDVVAPKSDRQIKKIEKTSIASGTRQLEKPRRSMGRVVQRRVGWNATPTKIMVTTAERELTKRDDGRLAPSGDWLIEHRKTFSNASGAAEKRVGKVKTSAPAPGASDTPQGSSVPSPASAGGDTFPEGQFALSLLPAQVRSSLIARVPTPTVFDGSVMLVSDSTTGEENHKEVNVIRMDDKRAVVIQAKLKPNTDEWEVSQATYTLSPPEIEQV